MATYILKIDSRNKSAIALLDYIFNNANTDEYVQIEAATDEVAPNKETTQALKDAENGKVTKTKTVNDLLNKLDK